MSSSKNGAVRNKLCQTSLISFNILYWPRGFVNGGEVEDSDVVRFIQCVPEDILIKRIGKLGPDNVSGLCNNIRVSQLKGKDVLNWTCQSSAVGPVLCS